MDNPPKGIIAHYLGEMPWANIWGELVKGYDLVKTD